MKYIVKRPHQGDKWYSEGANREAPAQDVAHLVANGVLVPSEAAAEDRAPADKVAPGLETKQSTAADAKQAE